MTLDWTEDIDWQDGPLYLAIAGALERAIDERRIAEGDSLPPQRELASRLGVALGTVTRAYAEAEKAGLIHAAPKRGTRVGKGDLPSVAFGKMGARPEGTIDLGINYPASVDDPDPAPALAAIARKLDRKALFRCAPPEGNPSHRRVYAKFLAEMGLAAETENVILPGGGQHGIFACLSALTQPGDHVATEALTFPGFRAAAASRGLIVHAVESDEFGIIPRSLDRLCAATRIKSLYAIPTFQNPTGTTMPVERKEELAAVAKKRDLLVLEDEIHRPLSAEARSSFFELAPERSFLISSVSKCLSGGLRAGCVAASPQWMPKLAEAVLGSLWCPPPLTFEILSIWMEDGTVRNTNEKRRSTNAQRMRMARSILAGHLDPRPGGGEASPFLWLRLPRPYTRERLATEALERGIAVATADLFAIEDPPEAVRLSLSGAPDLDRLARALTVITELIGLGSR